jgi:hypothetical protein
MKPRRFIGPVLFAALVLLPGVALAAAPSELNILDRFAVLEAKVVILEAQVRALQTQLLVQANSPVMALNPYLTVDPAQHRVRLTGVNLQLVNGTGRTDSINGRGNLILGYDLARDDDTSFCADGQYTAKEPCERYGHTWAVSHKTGSHYLVIGDRNNYAQYGGLVVGLYNTSIGPSGSVSGGMFNTARGPAASVSGGRENRATGLYSSVSGGNGNTASGPYTTVSGGEWNVASGPAAAVSAGQGNISSGIATSVSGGVLNTASEFFATVSAGSKNTASGNSASVSGGHENTARGAAASVSGGYQIKAVEPHDWAGGGRPKH